MAENVSKMDATDVLSAFGSGSLTPTDYARHVADMAERNQALNCLQHFDRDHLLTSVESAVAEHGGARLTGLPLVAKDNINTTNYPTSAGTRSLLDHTPAANAPVVEKLRAEGAVIGAKAGMHELAFGITSNNAVSGPVRNPHDQAMIPGGSSGGSAAAIAAGIFPAGLGTDTGGSCRIPAALCGIVGFRPTTGRYDSSGVVPISHTRDTVGTLARSVRDIVLLDEVITGETDTLEEVDLSGVTLGVARQVFFEDLEPAVEKAVQAQLDALAQAGAKIVEIDLSDIWPHNEAFGFPVVLYEVMRDLPAYLRDHAPGVSFETLLKGVGSADVAGALASQSGDEAMPESVYAEAINSHRPAMLEIYRRAFAQHGLDAIVFPTTPLTARPIGDDETVELNGKRVPTFPTYIRNTDLGSNLGAPGISLPCPVDSGLPVGIEFDGLPGQDRRLLALARAAERLMTNR